MGSITLDKGDNEGCTHNCIFSEEILKDPGNDVFKSGILTTDMSTVLTKKETGLLFISANKLLSRRRKR
jgi:hypothetical protein